MYYNNFQGQELSPSQSFFFCSASFGSDGGASSDCGAGAGADAAGAGAETLGGGGPMSS